MGEMKNHKARKPMPPPSRPFKDARGKDEQSEAKKQINEAPYFHPDPADIYGWDWPPYRQGVDDKFWEIK